MRTVQWMAAIALALALSGCDELVDLIDQAPCVQNRGDMRQCGAGEDIGQVPGESLRSHCCENGLYDVGAACTIFATGQRGISGQGAAKLAGYLSAELGVSQDTTVTGFMKLMGSHAAFHRQRAGHCGNHDSQCEDNDSFLVRKFDFTGSVTIGSALSVDGAATLINMGGDLNANIRVQARNQETVVSVGPFSLCEEADHEQCGSFLDTQPDFIISELPDGGITEIPWVPRDGGQ